MSGVAEGDGVIISFAWTTPALLAGAKKVTRREWSAEHARRFTVGRLVDAWDRSPRTGNGRKVATIRIVREPYRQSTFFVEHEDCVREGFDWLNEHGESAMVDAICRSWALNPREVWVVEFELVDRGPYFAAGADRVGGDPANAEHISNRRGDGARA